MKDSGAYTLKYSFIIGSVCATLLTVAGVVTNPRRDANALAEKNRHILRVLGVEFAKSASSAELVGIYEQAIQEEELPNGSKLYRFGGSSDGSVPASVAVELAGPGDCIHLTPSALPYRQSVTFVNKQGEPGRPLVLDGHGATLYGSEPLKTNEWPMIAPGLYRYDRRVHEARSEPGPASIGRYYSVRDSRTNGYTTLDELPRSTLQRWYFIFDGKMNLMGRSSKMQSQPLRRLNWFVYHLLRSSLSVVQQRYQRRSSPNWTRWQVQWCALRGRTGSQRQQP